MLGLGSCILLQQGSLGMEDNAKANKTEISDFDRFLYRYLGAQSPVVPLGCVITAGILLSGFRQFQKGNKMASQVFMRARVVAQGVTLGFMMTSIYIRDKQKRLGIEL
ncbi:hypothetical protein GUITHDRAFT_116145 [Guillardia theta CCMP2712]|uniref:HIG1 domain-containing protein n=1 Tax=Guillardia theta (strain CCMP2712) TaxID=905079 RepID=L1IN26_GUITC|nr:hypothetical protein GUITHDRAFT_116145 [Guillardia theta CCMP2712]EKX37668.1 hypothetical protein GUITHDRAFT_116145 [Guillardia theta CCMP2712]|eukprot:XP_005824648.1 hypothetical protein GUITHDRAFT_116145 [Guillardia theta CCMP2712]